MRNRRLDQPMWANGRERQKPVKAIEHFRLSPDIKPAHGHAILARRDYTKEAPSVNYLTGKSANSLEPPRGYLRSASIMGNLVEVQNRLACCLPRVRTKRATAGLC